LLFCIASTYILHRSSICIQLTTCLPPPNIVARPNFNGFLNSAKAPPSLLNTIPVRNITSRLFKSITGSMLPSHCSHVLPKKELSCGAVSTNGFGLGTTGSGPYQPTADELITAFILFGIVHRFGIGFWLY